MCACVTVGAYIGGSMQECVMYIMFIKSSRSYEHVFYCLQWNTFSVRALLLTTCSSQVLIIHSVFVKSRIKGAGICSI